MLDNRCPHMGFPLDQGSVEDGILTCHWHHARFELASGCTFDLWVDACRPARLRYETPARSGSGRPSAMPSPATLGKAVGGWPRPQSRARDRQGCSRSTGQRHLTLGYPPEDVIATLARALLREDASFHAYQMLEAGVRQFREWDHTPEGRHILVAVARYLAAHSPTERAGLNGRHRTTFASRRRAAQRGESLTTHGRSPGHGCMRGDCPS